MWLIGWVPRLGAIWLARVDLPAECFRVRYASLPRYCTKLCLLGFSAISASFSRNFSGLWAGFGSCFGDFCGFSYFFLGFFSAFGLGLGAVLGISAVSATFFWIFFGFWVDFGSCFKSFMDYSSTRACLLCYQPMAIVHYANSGSIKSYYIYHFFYCPYIQSIIAATPAFALSQNRLADC